MNKSLLTVGILLAASVVLLSVAYHIKPTDPSEIVYQYCNHSRIQDEPVSSEQTCGDLQDFYNVEFLCSKYNKSYNNTCWVEEK